MKAKQLIRIVAIAAWLAMLALITTQLPASLSAATQPPGIVPHLAPLNAPRDGNVWSALGSGLSNGGEVLALAVNTDGALYAGGNFYYLVYPSFLVNDIAKWDGSSWSKVGHGLDSGVAAIAVDASGNVYAGGFFTRACGNDNCDTGNTTVNYIAKWNGSSWSSLGSGMSGGTGGTGVWALAVDASQNLYVGGGFTTAGGVPANYIAKWDGSSWSALGTGMNDRVYALAVDGGNLYAGGNFTTAGGVSANRVAKWNGSTWSALGSGLNAGVVALAVDSNHMLYAGGGFTSAGTCTSANGCNRIAKWNGTTSVWSALGTGMNNTVDALLVDGSNVYAGGYFTTPANYIAKWNGSAWSALGTGMSGGTPIVYALAKDGDKIYAGGNFTAAGGTTAYHIAKWSLPTAVYVDPSSNCGGQTPCDTTVQTAVSDVSAGGTVNVNPATYNEIVNISKNQTLSATSGTVLIRDLVIGSGNVVTLSGDVQTTGDATGSVCRIGPFSTSQDYSFGNPNVKLNFASVTNNANPSITLNLAKSQPPEFTTAISRTYSITPTDVTAYNAMLYLRYTDAEVTSSGENESKLVLWRYNPSTSRYELRGGTVDQTNNFVSLSGVAEFSNWAIASNGAPNDVTLSTFSAHTVDNDTLMFWKFGIVAMMIAGGGIYIVLKLITR